jgi:hypothetical protein
MREITGLSSTFEFEKKDVGKILISWAQIVLNFHIFVLPYQVFRAEVCPEMLILQVGVRYTLIQR